MASVGDTGSVATAAAAADKHKPEVLHESLSLKVDLDTQRVEGEATLWVVVRAPAATATPAAAASASAMDDASEQHPSEDAPAPPQPIDFRLHARQMAISAVRVNGQPVEFSYPAPPLDLLRDMVVVERDGDRSAEALDLQYRCRFLAAQDGELGLQLPGGDGWSEERDREPGEVVPKAVSNVLVKKGLRVFKVAVDYTLDKPTAGLRFEARPRHCYSLRSPGLLHDVDGPRCWFPCADRSTDFFTVDMAVAVPNYEAEEDEDEEDDSGAAVLMEQDAPAVAVAVAAGTTGGGRRRPLTVIVGGGRLVKKERRRYPGAPPAVVWRYAIDSHVTAAAVSLVVGPFARWVDPAAPRVTHHYLVPDELPLEPDAPLLPSSPSEPTSVPVILPPKAWVKASVAGMGPVLGFLADFFDLTPPHQAPNSSSSSAAAAAAANGQQPPPAAAVPAAAATVTLEHRAVFVRGLPEAAVPFQGLALHRGEDLHPPTLFDSHMALHFALAEGVLAAWLLPRLRARAQRDQWIYHGVVGYLLLCYVRRRYGEHEYRYRLLRLMDQVAALERSGQAPPLLPAESMLFAPDAYNPYSLALLRAKPPIILHMIEHRIGRKPLRDVLRQVACPGPEEGMAGSSAAAATVAGGVNGPPSKDEDGPQSMDQGDGTGSFNDAAKPPAAAAATAPARAATDVRGRAWGTLNFLRTSVKTSARGDFLRNLRESWLEGRGPAYLRITYSYDRRAPKPEVLLRIKQIVPPWGRLFTGQLRFRVVEDNGTYDYERDISEAEHAFTFKLHSKVRKTGGGRRKLQAAAAAAAEGAAAGTASGVSSAAASGAEGQGDDESTVAGAAAAKKEGGGTGGGEKPKKRRKKADAAAAAEGGGEAGAAGAAAAGAGAGAGASSAAPSRPKPQAAEDEYAQARREHFSPVVFVKIDPELQWVTEVEWDLPEYCLVEQLHRDPDAAAQCLALRALTAYPRPGQEAAVAAAGVVGARSSLAAQAMADCVRGRVRPGWVEPPLCVRMEAARALAAWQNNHAPPTALNEPDGQWKGLNLMLQAYRERFYDASQRVPLPADFSDEAEYQLQKALVHAASLVRARDGGTPPQVWNFLRAVLEGHDNARNPFHDGAFLRTVLLAVANLRPPPGASPEAARLVGGLLPHVQRYFAWYSQPPQPDGLLLASAAAASSQTAAGAILGKDPGHRVLAAAIRALCNLELCRGGQPGALDYLQYARPVPPVGDGLSQPFDCLDLRLASVEAVCHLRVRERSEEEAGKPVTPEGPRRAVRWLLRVLEHDAHGGSLAFQYRALQVLFEALRCPGQYRPLRPHEPVALAHSRFLDHLDHEGPQYDHLDAGIFDPARPPLGSLESPALQALRQSHAPGPAAAIMATAASAHNGPPPPLPMGVLASIDQGAFVDADTQALRAAAAQSIAAARAALWTLIEEGAWACQPLRAMALCLHQLIWGYGAAAGVGTGGSGAPSPEKEGAVPGFAKGLDDVWMELLDYRSKGTFSLRASLFDARDWRTWRDTHRRAAKGGAKASSAAGSAGREGEGADDGLSDEERQERNACRDRSEGTRKTATTLKFKRETA